jgi:integrase/recombinase XerD
MKLRPAIEEFVRYKQSLGAVYKADATSLKAFLRRTGNVELKALTGQQVEDHLPILIGMATSNWYSKYYTLARFFRFAASRGFMEHQVLPTSLPERPVNFVPYIYSTQDMHRLLGVPDSHYSPVSPLTPYTTRTLVLLLYGAGLRLGEAIHLKPRDVDLSNAILTIRNTKFSKSRLVPIGTDLAHVLCLYWERQCLEKDPLSDPPFLITRRGGSISQNHADNQFKWLRMAAGVLRFDTARYQPRLHDLRHTFAVNRIVAWYREGKDVQRLLPQLCTYMGHVRIDETATYLRMTAELLQEANHRFERYAEGEA